MCPGSVNSKLVVRKDQGEPLPSLFQGSSLGYSLPAKNWSLPPATLGGLRTPLAQPRCVPGDGTGTT